VKRELKLAQPVRREKRSCQLKETHGTTGQDWQNVNEFGPISICTNHAICTLARMIHEGSSRNGGVARDKRIRDAGNVIRDPGSEI
jgi:hypothetical protein